MQRITWLLREVVHHAQSRLDFLAFRVSVPSWAACIYYTTKTWAPVFRIENDTKCK